LIDEELDDKLKLKLVTEEETTVADEAF